jgi:hypothetical protein
MKIKTIQTKDQFRVVVAIACIASIFLNSCTTQSTAYQVTQQPMTVDLEKKVLRETSLSGAAIGAVAGAAGGAILAGGITAIAGGSSEQIAANATAGAIGGGIGGGYTGYKKGQQKGQQMVAASMTRDQARELVKGARAHNQQLISYNNGLRSKINSVNKFSDPKQKKLAYKSLAKQTNAQIKDTDKLLATRKKALQSDKWAKGTDAEKSQYRALTKDLETQRSALASYSAQLSKLEQSVVY